VRVLEPAPADEPSPVAGEQARGGVARLLRGDRQAPRSGLRALLKAEDG